MSAAEIIAEVSAALTEAGADAGAGTALTVTLTRASAEADEPQNPWDAPASPANDPTLFTVKALDPGIREIREGGVVVRRARVIMVEAGVVVPLQSDLITIRGVTHEIQAVRPVAPAGVSLFYKLEIKS